MKVTGDDIVQTIANAREREKLPADFTVFTAAFNRPIELDRLFKSLVKQSGVTVQWVIVDNSNQPTVWETIEVMAAAELVAITAIKVDQNRHKKVAFNHAICVACGEYFICLDDDDELTRNALGCLLKHWEDIRTMENTEARVGAVAARCVASNLALIGPNPCNKPFIVDFAEAYLRGQFHDEWSLCLKTTLLKPYRYPEDIPGYVPEGVVWLAFADKHPIYVVGDVVRIFHTTPNSVSRNSASFKGLADSAPGAYFYYRFLLERFSIRLASNTRRRYWVIARIVRNAKHTKMIDPTTLQRYPMPALGWEPLAIGWGNLLYIFDFLRAYFIHVRAAIAGFFRFVR